MLCGIEYTNTIQYGLAVYIEQILTVQQLAVKYSLSHLG